MHLDASRLPVMQRQQRLTQISSFNQTTEHVETVGMQYQRGVMTDRTWPGIYLDCETSTMTAHSSCLSVQGSGVSTPVGFTGR